MQRWLVCLFVLAVVPAVAEAAGDWPVFTQPAGWQRSADANVITLASGQARLAILPVRVRTGSIADQFHQIWTELIDALFTDDGDAKGPQRRRLASGYAVALDGGSYLPKAGGNTRMRVGLYLVYTDERVVPIVGVSFTPSDERTLEAFFASVSIAGVPASKTPLFDRRELTGHWDTKKAVYASRVNANTGQYVGNASISTWEQLDLNADGTFKRHFLAIPGQGAATKQDRAGAWRIDDDFLVLVEGKSEEKIRIWSYGTSPKGVAGSFATVIYGTNQPLFNDPTTSFLATWYSR